MCIAISPSTISRLRASTRFMSVATGRHQSEPIRVVDQIGDFCAPDFVLAGKTVGVRAGAANKFPFDDGGAMPRFGHVPGE
jgi:hypothetical protein